MDRCTNILVRDERHKYIGEMFHLAPKYTKERKQEEPIIRFCGIICLIFRNYLYVCSTLTYDRKICAPLSSRPWYLHINVLSHRQIKLTYWQRGLGHWLARVRMPRTGFLWQNSKQRRRATMSGDPTIFNLDGSNQGCEWTDKSANRER